MGENIELNEHTIIPILDRFRKPNGNKPRNGKVNHTRRLKTFKNIVSDEWNALKLDEEPDFKLIELIIINSIEELYGSWDQETDETTRRRKARMRDASLLSFGLLDGYYHTKRKVNTWLSDRYNEYLENSDFVKIDYPGEGSYKEIARKDKIRKPGKQPRPLGSLTGFVYDGKEQIASKVFDIIDGKIYKGYLDKDGEAQMFELPKPCYTLKNFPLPTEQEEESDPCQPLVEDALSKNDSSARKTEAFGKKEKQSPKEKYWGKSTDAKLKIKDKDTKDFIIKCSVVALLVIAVISAFARVLIVIHNNNVSQKAVLAALENSSVNQKPSSIRFSNPDEWLPFGQPTNLTVNPSPDDATLDGLRCKSEGDNAHMIEVLSEPGLHIKAIDEFDGSEPCNVSVKAYMEYNDSISDVVTIHVIKDGENEPTGEGELDDKSSGNSSQKAD